ncbi:hypothetical protein JT31_05745 [Cedecea neteri]|jgi:hypothetical protein|uniref:Uncharacterized protein n=1 Tax=Cedecea neteri TaxID=158822 RepID=A0A089PYS4_9ENTR|nr:hypothetical protein JT31_05745 [Cedecea neteri]
MLTEVNSVSHAEKKCGFYKVYPNVLKRIKSYQIKFNSMIFMYKFIKNRKNIVYYSPAEEKMKFFLTGANCETDPPTGFPHNRPEQ